MSRESFLQAFNLCNSVAESYNEQYSLFYTHWRGKAGKVIFDMMIHTIDRPGEQFDGQVYKANFNEYNEETNTSKRSYWRSYMSDGTLKLAVCTEEVYKYGWLAFRDGEGRFV